MGTVQVSQVGVGPPLPTVVSLPVPPDTARFVKALRTAHTVAFRLEVWRGGKKIGVVPYVDGEVQAQRVTGIRRSYNLTVPATTQWKTLLATPGLELRPYRGINFGYGAPQLYPLGRFPVMANSINTDVGSGIPIAANDYWGLVAADQFPFPRASPPSGQISSIAATLINESLSQVGLPNCIVTATATTAITPVVWDSDRSAAIADLMTAINAEAFIDANGQAWIQDRKQIGTTGYPIIDGDMGTRVSLVATTDWSGIFNIISVRSTTTDPALVFPNITVAITDATSPAYWQRIGRRVFPFSSAQVYTTDQATAVAKTLLLQKSIAARTLSIDCVPNMQLTEGDTIATAIDGIPELAQIQTITYPMVKENVQKITTVSGGGSDGN